MTEEKDPKLEFYKDEYVGAPLVEYIGFRCTKRLSTWLRAQGAIEGRDHSAVIRRLLTWAAEKEGYDRNGF